MAGALSPKAAALAETLYFEELLETALSGPRCTTEDCWCKYEPGSHTRAYESAVSGVAASSHRDPLLKSTTYPGISTSVPKYPSTYPSGGSSPSYPATFVDPAPARSWDTLTIPHNSEIPDFTVPVIYEEMVIGSNVPKEVRVQAMRTAAYIMATQEIVLLDTVGTPVATLVPHTRRFAALWRFLATLLMDGAA